MKSLFRRRETPQPFLAPLAAAGRLSRLTRRMGERLPPVAAPLAVTVVGGTALLAAIGMLSGPNAGGGTTVATTPDAPRERVEAPAAAPQPARPAVEETAAETASDLAAAVEPEGEPDPARTASILPALSGAQLLMPPVPVAETEEEVAALEEAQRREVEADIGAPSLDETASLGRDAAPKRPARTSRHVNMRAGPDDGAQVLMVVPAQAEMEAEGGCGWCEVTYRGRTGYIYKSFIRYAD